MTDNYNNLMENEEVQPYLYAVINLGHSVISGMLAYKSGACVVPVCLKSCSSNDIFHHGLLKNATAFREKIADLINHFETEIKRLFKNRVELTNIYVGITPISMQLVDWTYRLNEEKGEQNDTQAKLITKGILSKLKDDCLNDFLEAQKQKRGNRLQHIASLKPIYYVDKDFDTPYTAESLDHLIKKDIMVKQQMLCVKEKYVQTIKDQITSIYSTKTFDITFLANPLVEARQWEEEECQDYIYVNMGAGSTSIFMTDKRVLYKMFVYPIGTHSITNDIQKFFSISSELAEQLKLKYSRLDNIEIDGTIETAFKYEDVVYNGKSYSITNLNKLVFVRMREILMNVKAYIKNSYRHTVPNKIVFYGGGTKLVGFEELLKYLEFDFCDVELVSDLEAKVNQTLSNIHQIHWDRNEISSEQLFTLISLVNSVSSMDSYFNEEQGYSVYVNNAIAIDEDEEYQTPVRKQPHKTITEVNNHQPIQQEELFEPEQEETTEIVVEKKQEVVKEEHPKVDTSIQKEEEVKSEEELPEEVDISSYFF